MSSRAARFAVLCAPALAVAAFACSSSDDSSDGVGGGATSCSDESLTVSFSPMYSAFEPGHPYQVPAVVDGVAATAVKWGISDESIATIAKDSTTGGVMLTIKKAGTANVVASAGTLCGSSKLTVTDVTSDQWTTGNQRYNNGVNLKPFGPGQHDGGSADGGPTKDVACTNCHGPTANGAFKDVAHTPEQTGGFSDDELENIFRHGTVPDGGYFDDSIIGYNQWQQFHTWDMTDDEAKGIIVYLRSLTPTAQEGAANFGGRFRDGGRPPGHHDGGGGGTGTGQ